MARARALALCGDGDGAVRFTSAQPAALADELRRYGTRDVLVTGSVVSAWVSSDAMAALDLAHVEQADIEIAATRAGVVTSQGDSAHYAGLCERATSAAPRRFADRGQSYPIARPACASRADIVRQLTCGSSTLDGAPRHTTNNKR